MTTPDNVQLKLLKVREEIQRQHQQTNDENLFNPLVSPGPASITLLNNTTKKISKKAIANKVKINIKEGNKKGLVAAAALGLAVTRPFPLKGENKSNNNNTDQQRRRILSNSYIVDKQSNVVTCKCGSNDKFNDSYSKLNFIQCNNCHRWQHMICYSIKNKADIVPTKFYCNICQPDLSRDSYQINKKFLQKKKHRLQNTTIKLNEIQSHQKNNISHSNNILNLTNGVLSNAPYSTSFKRSCSISSAGSGSASDSSNKNSSMESELHHNYTFKDKYVKLFIDDHNNDDWVVPFNKELKFSDTYKAEDGRIIATDLILKDSYVAEFIGAIDFQKNYTIDPENQYRIWGTTQEKVIFHPHWPICIDARNNTYQSIISGIRRSCNPNVELRTIKIGSTDEIKFVITSVKPIAKGEELTINWQWDLRHPICQITDNDRSPESLTDMDKFWLVHSIDTLWESCPCACQDDNCKLLKAKKFAESFYNILKSKIAKK